MESIYCWFIFEMSRLLSIQSLRTLLPTSNIDSYSTGEGNLNRRSPVRSIPVGPRDPRV